VRVDRQRGGIFLKLFSLRVDPAKPHLDLHQNALAAAFWAGMSWSIRRLTHMPSSLDYTAQARKVESHASAAYAKRLLSSRGVIARKF
jgi:hypothetical protein